MENLAPIDGDSDIPTRKYVADGLAGKSDTGHSHPAPPGGGSSGHTIQDEGTPLAARTDLDFVGTGVAVADDAANNKPVVTIPGGVTDHTALTGRSTADSHPTAAITGLDAALAGKEAVGAALPKTGGTMTGDIVLKGAPTAVLHPATKQYTDAADALSLPKTGGTVTGGISISTAAGAVANFATMSSGLLRWTFGKSNIAESGANAGSDFNVARWDDAGNWLGNTLTIVRKTGKAIFEGDLQTAYAIFIYGADMGGSKITGLANGTVAGDAVSKAQLDTKWTMWTGTQAAYDAIGTKDQSTLYVVTG